MENRSHGPKNDRHDPPKKAFLRHTHKKHILQKNWSKTIICGLSSGRNNLPQPIWVHSLQLDDRHRNPNINIREIIWLGATTHDRRSTSHYKNNTSIYFHRILLCFVILRSPRLLTIFSVLQARQKHGRTHHRHSKRLHKIPDL